MYLHGSLQETVQFLLFDSVYTLIIIVINFLIV